MQREQSEREEDCGVENTSQLVYLALSSCRTTSPPFLVLFSRFDSLFPPPLSPTQEVTRAEQLRGKPDAVEAEEAVEEEWETVPRLKPPGENF